MPLLAKCLANFSTVSILFHISASRSIMSTCLIVLDTAALRIDPTSIIRFFVHWLPQATALLKDRFLSYG
ncbi:hypothetical protein HETIRDRAFT_166215 [Heterobasidion irregulare TC 32-1]|uniref:Uncharacterized protein n=1 Tax=Heterobasidion irregulare (strain TC 32-1) TaxID=747525 RepID=W4KLG7_HETIT|nr:uncharacterized protein HETIRDRAFT_166215 [Heterobasidion irregulare TC 32-1]ETW86698.1 hypothetical protein HETIRDRAFT_166215 [Heterobasidion irregulare TC 32-1]